MLGSVGSRHISSMRRRGSSPMVRGAGLTGYVPAPGTSGGSNDPSVLLEMKTFPPKRRKAVTTSDYKSCALVQTRMKFGDITTVDSRWRCDENNCNVVGSVNSRTVVAGCGGGQRFVQPLLGMIFSHKTVRA
ncbi:unnamed protein product, partial [Heterotrigona itama]